MYACRPVVMVNSFGGYCRSRFHIGKRVRESTYRWPPVRTTSGPSPNRDSNQFSNRFSLVYNPQSFDHREAETFWSELGTGRGQGVLSIRARCQSRRFARAWKDLVPRRNRHGDWAPKAPANDNRASRLMRTAKTQYMVGYTTFIH